MDEIKNVLVCGKGEIGTAIGEVAQQAGMRVRFYDPPKNIFPPKTAKLKNIWPGYDVVHVCYSINKLQEIYDITDYVRDDGVIVIDATINVGFAGSIQGALTDEGHKQLLLHSPVRGRHPNMVDGLKKYVKFVGPADPSRITEAANFCRDYYTKLGIKWQLLSSADNAAAGKLFDTTWYLTQITFANQVAMYCAQKNLNFNEVYNRFQETGDTGRKFEVVDGRAICMKFVPRPVMVPGAIGGHCLLPNLELIKGNISPAYYSWVKQMNDYFTSEVKAFVEKKGTETASHEGDKE
jgi:hypothetical protein